jgi:hypothetical protein
VGKRRFRIAWLPLREASSFIAEHHRHHAPPQGGIVALGCWEGMRLVGCGVIGRPVSRELQRQGYCEVTRSCTREDIAAAGDHANCAASALLGRLRRVADALGFAKMVSYTLPDELGSSLRGAGWTQDEMLTGGGEGNRPGRPREAANYPTMPKRRWRRAAGKQGTLVDA